MQVKTEIENFRTYLCYLKYLTSRAECETMHKVSSLANFSRSSSIEHKRIVVIFFKVDDDWQTRDAATRARDVVGLSPSLLRFLESRRGGGSAFPRSKKECLITNFALLSCHNIFSRMCVASRVIFSAVNYNRTLSRDLNLRRDSRQVSFCTLISSFWSVTFSHFDSVWENNFLYSCSCGVIVIAKRRENDLKR